MRELMQRFGADQAGATAIEYGLIAALIALAIVAGFSAVSSGVLGVFRTVSNHLPAS